MLNERVLKILEYYSQALEDIRPKRTSIRVKLGRGSFNARRLARYCDKANRRVCEEALRLVSLYFREGDVLEALKWARENSVRPEVLIAYLYGFVVGVLKSINPTPEQLASLSKVRVDLDRFSLSLEALKGDFTMADAMNLLPGLRARS